jgi:Methylase of chemotaxis methyl-accepting proteins
MHFDRFTTLIHDRFGIYLNEIKRDMLKIRLTKLMTKYGLSSYDEYYNILTQCKDGRYISEFAEEITINKTDFFRENSHFEFLKGKLNFILEKNRRIIKNNEIRVWSSACSSGEEAYTIAMVLKECLPQGVNIKILATDISNKVLLTAKKGIYPPGIKDEIEGYYIIKYFNKNGVNYEIENSIKEFITFRSFNLMDNFPFKDTFDMIFCRNVMIYFDINTQQKLLDKFHNVITPGGLLFIGHSESLTNKTHRFQYVQPTIYIK